jgi:hypothetical protein
MAVIHTDSPVIERDYRSYDRDGSGLGTMLAVIIALAVLFLLLFYGLPLLRGAANTTSPQVNVPEKIDVNVNRQ